MSKFIIITGGVVSGIGKGVVAASTANLLKRIGYSVSILKCDPYINVDPGTLNPKQHGEVFVTQDGAETDLDLGHYERFIYEPLSVLNTMSTGQIYDSVIKAERQGKYKGHTVQIFHIVEEIKRRIYYLAGQLNPDFLIIEIGGTVGDIESIPFLETVRQIQSQEDKEDTCSIHVVYVPFLSSVGEHKTKPAQHSVSSLRSSGISPDIIITRAEDSLSKHTLDKISSYCYVPSSNVIDCPNVDSIYQVPKLLLDKNFLYSLNNILEFNWNNTISLEWDNTLNFIPSSSVSIALVGKYTSLKDSYISIIEALKHAAWSQSAALDITYVDVSSKNYTIDFDSINGVIVPGGFGENGTEDIIDILKHCRENKIPTFGICMGMQLMCIEFARHVLNLPNANSIEFDPSTPYPIFDILPDKNTIDIGGTLRLGSYPCNLHHKDSITMSAYSSLSTKERHRHRYEFNNAYRGNFITNDCLITGTSPDKSLVEIIEFPNHPWFIGTQFHPEFQSNLLQPHPLFVSFIKSLI